MALATLPTVPSALYIVPMTFPRRWIFGMRANCPDFGFSFTADSFCFSPQHETNTSTQRHCLPTQEHAHSKTGTHNLWLVQFARHRCKIVRATDAKLFAPQMQTARATDANCSHHICEAVRPTDAKLFTLDCTGTLLLLTIPFHSICSPPH